MGDVFESALFKQTFQRVFAKDAKEEFKTAYAASIEVKVGNTTSFKACILHGILINKRKISLTLYFRHLKS